MPATPTGDRLHSDDVSPALANAARSNLAKADSRTEQGQPLIVHQFAFLAVVRLECHLMRAQVTACVSVDNLPPRCVLHGTGR